MPRNTDTAAATAAYLAKFATSEALSEHMTSLVARREAKKAIREQELNEARAEIERLKAGQR